MEIWKDIPDYEGLYLVSNLGNVKSLSRKVKSPNGFRQLKSRILKPAPNSKGYLTVSLSKSNVNKTFKVHQLVAMSFLNHKPCGMNVVVDHKNEIITDNNSSNLQLITNRKNLSRSKVNVTSQYTGVSWDSSRNKWKASAFKDGKSRHIGMFKSDVEASISYQNFIKNE